MVDHQRGANRLAALRAAGAARQYRRAFFGRNGDRRACRFFGTWQDDADRFDLVDRSVGGVATAARAVEKHLGVALAAQAIGECVACRADNANGCGRRVHRAK